MGFERVRGIYAAHMKTTLFIRGMHDLISQSEIKDALEKEVGNEGIVHIGDLGRITRKSKSVTVVVGLLQQSSS